MDIQFDRFDDMAKKVMSLANQEAMRLNHEYVGAEHIFLALTLEVDTVAMAVLQGLGLDISRIRSDLKGRLKSGPSLVTMGRLSFTPRAKKILELAMEEASRLRHGYIGTEHLLLGLMAEGQGIPFQVLSSFELSLEGVRAAVVEFLGINVPAPQVATPPPTPTRKEKFAEIIRGLRKAADDLESLSGE